MCVGGGGQATYTFSLRITCKGGGGVQIACEIAYVLEGSLIATYLSQMEEPLFSVPLRTSYSFVYVISSFMAVYTHIVYLNRAISFDADSYELCGN